MAAPASAEMLVFLIHGTRTLPRTPDTMAKLNPYRLSAVANPMRFRVRSSPEYLTFFRDDLLQFVGQTLVAAIPCQSI
jgi:hypothetical protein